MKDPLRKILRKDTRYARERYHFVQEALEHALQHAFELAGEKRHVSGQELLEAARNLARQNFGLLAPTVFRTWGVNSGLDFGHIVFNLVDAKLMKKQPGDSLDDFRNGFDFDELAAPEAK